MSVDYDVEAFDAYEAAGWAAKDVARYHGLAGLVTASFADPLLDAARVRAGARVLDVATGPGYVAARAAERGAEAVGLDLSDAMLAHARARNDGIELVRGDATALPFAAGSFDAVVAAFVLLHLGRPELAAAEAARVLVPGGRVAMSVWDEPKRGRWLGVLLDAVAAARAGPPPDIPPGPPLFRFADPTEFTALLTGVGFVDVTVEVLDSSLRLQSADELWRGLIDGTVRVGPLVRSQPEDVQREIRERFDEQLEPYRNGSGFEVPVAVKLASGSAS